MTNTNMRKGFTMIELIFVIVIIGILAAVAIPKLAGTQKEARASVIEGFLGTMNRTVLPSMYAKAIRNDNGVVKNYPLLDYIELPKDLEDINITKCADSTASKFKSVGTTSLDFDIYCRDGNLTNPPLFSFSEDDYNTTLPAY